MKLRYLLWVIVLLLVTGLLFVPRETPPWFQLAGWSAALLMTNFLFGDLLLGRWLRGQIGRQVTIGQFFVDSYPVLLIVAGFSLACCSGVLLIRLGEEGATGMVLLSLLGLGGLGLLAGLAAPLMMPSTSEKGRLAEIRSRLPVKPIRVQIRDAWEFQRVCGFRVAIPLAVLWTAALAALALVLGCCLGLALLSDHLSGGIDWSGPDEWPFLFKTAVFLGILSTSCILASVKLASFRIIAIMRKQGRFSVGRVWRQAGVSLETVGVLGTFVWGAAMTLAIGALTAAGYLMDIAARETLKLDAGLALAASASVALALAWFLLFLPQMYVLPVMVRRDCGWMRAIEISLDLISLERGGALVKAAIATAMALTIVGIPGAIALLMGTLDHQDLFLAAVLGERTDKDIFDELAQSEIARPAALQKHYDMLEKGRYLDALNGFQMFLRMDRQNTDAWRGQSLAYLRMGNPMARESLEMWAKLAEEPQEAEELLAEYGAGLWAENGAKFQEADRRCTQRIGTGVMGPGRLSSGPGVDASSGQ